MNPIEKDPLQSRLEITNWIVLAGMIIMSLILFPRGFTFGIILGSLISIINFHWLYRDLRQVFSNLSGNVKRRIMFKYYIRLTVTAVVLYLIITREVVDVVGLVLGLSVVIINIALTTLITYRKKNCLEEVK